MAPDLWLIALVAFAFAWTNGFHDASNAIATSVTTRALTRRLSVVLAAVGNLIGAVIGLALVTELASDLVVVGSGGAASAVAAAFVVALGWNLLTWARGMPSSSTHALLAALVGGALTLGGVVHWAAVAQRVAVPMLLSPALGLGVALGLTALLRRWVHRDPAAAPGTADAAPTVGALRQAQTISAAMVAVAHGVQDAAKPVAVLALAGTAAKGAHLTDVVPLWVFAGIAVALALGTLAGGWRVVHTLGRGIVDLDTPSGFAAETATALVLAAATAIGAPVSSTQTVAAAIVGTGLARGHRAVRWVTVRRVLLTWVLTPLACGAVGAALTAALHAL